MKQKPKIIKVTLHVLCSAMHLQEGSCYRYPIFTRDLLLF